MRPVAYLCPTKVPSHVQVNLYNGTFEPKSAMTDLLKMVEHAHLDTTTTLVVEWYLSPDGPYGDGTYGLVWAGDYGPKSAPGGQPLHYYVDELLASDDMAKLGTAKPVLMSWETAFETHALKRGEILNAKSWRYIVNHTKKTYLDKAVLSLEDDSLFHPMCILTAEGNGCGGGDYHGINKTRASLWAYDVVGVSNEIPIGYNCTTDWSSTDAKFYPTWPSLPPVENMTAEKLRERYMNQAYEIGLQEVYAAHCKAEDEMLKEFEDDCTKAEAAGLSLNDYLQSIGKDEYYADEYAWAFEGAFEDHICDKVCEQTCFNNGVNPHY